MAIAHKILVAIFHMLQRGTAFADLGGISATTASRCIVLGTTLVSIAAGTIHT